MDYLKMNSIATPTFWNCRRRIRGSLTIIILSLRSDARGRGFCGRGLRTSLRLPLKRSLGIQLVYQVHSGFNVYVLQLVAGDGPVRGQELPVSSSSSSGCGSAAHVHTHWRPVQRADGLHGPCECQHKRGQLALDALRRQLHKNVC